MMLKNKMYNTWEEYFTRMANFLDNFAHIRSMGGSVYDLNEFADMSDSEFSASRNGFRPELRTSPRNEIYLPEANADKVDWRGSGAVTPVKNQGSCGSCWAFSSTGALEAAFFFKGKTLDSFSEQQLVDCSTSFGNQGCNGGLMDQAFKYLESNSEEQESDYPYSGLDGKCAYASSKGVTKVSTYNDVPQTAAQLKAALQNGPVAVAVKANLWWQLYFGGVSKACYAGTKADELNHGVLAVGYDDTASVPFWIIKNSWGESWGEQGYIRLAQSNDCGITLSASVPQV